MSGTEPMKRTITKSDIAQDIYLEYNRVYRNKGCVSPRQAVEALNSYVDQIKGYLKEHNSVVLKCYGKLVTLPKSGGRPVRNPKTGEEMPMRDIVTVTLGGPQGKGVVKNPRINPSKMIEDLSNNLGNSKLAHVVTDCFSRALEETTSGDTRIEIRGFGVFTSNTLKGRNGRNPKTGILVRVEPHEAKSFRVSKCFKNELTNNYFNK